MRGGVRWEYASVGREKIVSITNSRYWKLVLSILLAGDELRIKVSYITQMACIAVR